MIFYIAGNEKLVKYYALFMMFLRKKANAPLCIVWFSGKFFINTAC